VDTRAQGRGRSGASSRHRRDRGGQRRRHRPAPASAPTSTSASGDPREGALMFPRMLVVVMAVLAVSAAQRDVRAAAAGLTSADPVARTKAACELRELGHDAAPALPQLAALLADGSPVEAAVCGERTWRFRGGDDQTTPGEQAASAMVAIGSQAYSPFTKALVGAAWIARRNAAWGLGALDASEAVPALIEALKDPEAGGR